ncbi:DUF2163 domain-containing protein [Methylocystis parvus]|uniref:DUF2163 domain-containing protein n=1 Tax=Methylocystis parvus TaxID=134 RepID=A0A6B8M3K9_9HYPH|nr:DUF2163 domain-containing protein [Methylocystis parvus]QGM96329.1 DUF2163 domain-containing protein [Methylocystis parvus]WBJ99832.1 DUF2163 domain-containing protein [Methylocystis parvus OBBP]
MRQLTVSMQAKLDARATTFCHCWRLARRDGVIMGFTDHDRDLAFGDVTYRANTGLSASQIESMLGFGVGGAEASGALVDDGLCETDLLNGLYDGASVETWLVDWSRLEDRALLDVCTVGEIRRGEHVFSAELRSAAHVFDQPRGRAFQRGCAADLGDPRCRVDLDAASLRTTGAVVAFAGGVLTLDLAAPFETGFFAAGALSFLSGANERVRLTIKTHRQDGLRASIAFWTPPGGSISPGDMASLVGGCDKSPGACQNKFDNIVNFRGFPHMPGNDRVIAYPNSLAKAMDGGSFFR